jgi:hypothetical protein
LARRAAARRIRWLQRSRRLRLGSRVAVLALAAACPLLLAASCWRHPLAPWAQAALVCVIPLALAALGVARRGRLGRRGIALGALLALLLLGVLGVVATSGTTFGRGWPAGLAILLGGVWLLPMAVSLWAHTAMGEES